MLRLTAATTAAPSFEKDYRCRSTVLLTVGLRLPPQKNESFHSGSRRVI